MSRPAKRCPPKSATTNPPSALFAGADGLDDYRIIATQLPALIAPGGMAAIEIGATQADAVTALLTAQGLNVAVRRDLGGPRPLPCRHTLIQRNTNPIFLLGRLPGTRY